MASTRTVEAGRTLLVTGPCALTFLSGRASVLSAPLAEDQKILIKELKRVPVFAEDRTDFEIALGAGGSLSEVEGDTIPNSWKNAVDAVQALGTGIVAILGGVDSGKSTICGYLANALHSRGLRVRIIDADIGQADLGPPATISSLKMRACVPSMGDLEGELRVFVGHVTPSRVEAKLLQGVSKLLRATADDELVLVNTDGWVGEPDAVRFKLDLIRNSGVNLLVALGDQNELQEILTGSGIPSLTVDQSKAVRARSQSERRRLREAGYRRFLTSNKAFDLYLDNLRLQPPPGFSGDAASFARRGKPERLMVGLVDEEGYLEEIGVCGRLWLAGRRVQVFARRKPDFSTLEFSCVRLSDEGEELGFFD